MAPLVKDINTLYDGVTFQNSSSISGYTTIRSVIGCAVCDLPATRKVCGFANFNANCGCSKCMKTFIQPPRLGVNLHMVVLIMTTGAYEI